MPNQKIDMMLTDVYSTTSPSDRNQKYEYTAYRLTCEGKTILVNADLADKKIKEWKKQGFPYSQIKWFLWQENQ